MASVLLAGVSVLLVVLLRAPASWLDPLVAAWTHNRVRLADVSGTVWAGRGRLVLADAVGRAPAEAGWVVRGLAVPGVFAWRVSPAWLCLGRVRAHIEHDSMTEPVMIDGSLHTLRVSRGQLLLPGLALDKVGSPWNTIRPFVSLTLAWEPWQLQQGEWQGQARITLSDVAAALTPVRPLGAYQLDVKVQGRSAHLQMTTLSGPLRLSGSGSWDGPRGVQFVAWAQADEAERSRLSALLGLLGRRQGERTMIKIGA